MTRRPKPKNAAPNTIFTSFKIHPDGSGKIRYSGEPIPVLEEGESFTVPVAWGFISNPPVEWELAPLESCKCSPDVRDATPNHVLESEFHYDYTAWFEYLLDSARAK